MLKKIAMVAVSYYLGGATVVMLLGLAWGAPITQCVTTALIWPIDAGGLVAALITPLVA